MDVKTILINQIKRCRRKMNLAKCIDCGILSAAAGGIFGICCELASFVWQFYYVHLAAGLCFGAGLFVGAGYALYRRAGMEQAAMRLDSFGLEERMITAYEQMKHEQGSFPKDDFVLLQRQDAYVHYNQVRGQIKIPLLPDKRHILALLVSALAVLVLALIPSPLRRQAQLHHQVQEQAEAELDKLDELLEALEGVDRESLTEEQRQLLQETFEAMRLSREELAKADTWESLASAREKLDYKYGQTAQSLEGLSGQLAGPEAAGIASAEALAKAAANQAGQQLAASATPGAGSGDAGGDGTDSGSDSGSGDNGSGQGEDSGDSGDNGQSGSSGDGAGQDGSAGAGGNNGQGSGSGADGSGGQDSGSGSGQGDGRNGNGNGGSGDASGSGRGTGSSDAAHDYVSIPNAVAEDSSLTGNRYGDQNSDYYRQQNGLAWEGEHVDYNAVIGEYTDNAYEGLASGRYPSGMEPVIRDYFQSLNQ